MLTANPTTEKHPRTDMSTILPDRTANEIQISPEQNGKRQLYHLPVKSVKNLSPRRYYPESHSLKESIAEQGVIEPIIVAPLPNEQFKIVAGRQRHAACAELIEEGRLSPDATIPALMHENDLEEIELSENLLRREYDVVQEAELLKNFMFKRGFKYGSEVARALHINERTVQRTLSVNEIPEEIRTDYLEFTVQTLENWGYVPFKRTQIVDLAQKPKGQQIKAWNAMKEKAMKERDAREQKSISKTKGRESSEETSSDHVNSGNGEMEDVNKNSKPRLSRKELPPLANDHTEILHEGTPQSVIGLQTVESEAVSTKEEIPVPDHIREIHNRAKFHDDNHEVAVEQSVEPHQPIDLETRLPDYQYYLTAILEDLGNFNPVGYSPSDRVHLMEDLELFENGLTFAAGTVRDIRLKLESGTEIVQAQLSALKADVLDTEEEPEKENEIPANASRNSFDELYRAKISRMSSQELETWELKLCNERKLNPSIKKRNSTLYEQLLHNALIQYWTEERHNTFITQRQSQ
jgi:ParB/RepB/Spo0J family partition protein